MQAKTRGSSVWVKMLMALLSVALVFTMVPLTMGNAYADTASEGTVFTIVDTDGTVREFTMDEIKAFNGPKTEAYELTDGTMVKGIYVKALLKSYADAGKGSAVATVTTADNYSPVNADGKTVDYLRSNDYILAFEVNGVEIDPTVEKTKPSGKTYYDAGYFYLYGKIDGEHKCDKYVDKIVLTEPEEETPAADTVFTIVDTDGTTKNFTMDEIKSFNGPKTEAYELTDGTMVKGIYVKALLKSYADAGKGSAIASVTTADNYDQTKINANGKTVDYLRSNDYILAFEVDGVEIDPTVEKTKPSGKTYYDAGYFYLYGKIDGEHKCDKYVDKIVLTQEGGEDPGEDPTEDAALTITGNALKSDLSFATLDELINDENVKAKTKEDVVFNWKNSSGTEGTAKVTGVPIVDLIQPVLKDNMEVKLINVFATDDWNKSYPADIILKQDRDGNYAMFAWTYWASDKNKTETNQQRTIIGQFEAGEVNQSNWGKKINKIEVVGEEKASEPETTPAPAVKDGQTVTVEGNTYTVLSASAGTVAFTKAKNTKRAIVPVSVKVDGKTYKVTQVNANAFTGSKIKSAVVNKNVTKIKKNAFKSSKAVQLIVKTKKLTKKSVKGSLKGSKIKKVVVKVGSKKANKKYLKKYKKYFTKKNAGKKVKVVKAN